MIASTKEYCHTLTCSAAAATAVADTTSGSGRLARTLSSLDLFCLMRSVCEELAKSLELAVGRCFKPDHWSVGQMRESIQEGMHAL